MYSATITFTTLIDAQDEQDAMTILEDEVHEFFPGADLDIRVKEID